MFYDDDESDEEYAPAQFKKEKSLGFDVTTSFSEPLQWRTEDVYFIEIKHRMSGRMMEKGGPYSFLLADTIMKDLAEKNSNQQWLISLKKEAR